MAAQTRAAPLDYRARRDVRMSSAITSCLLFSVALVSWWASLGSMTTMHQVAFSSFSVTAVAWAGSILMASSRPPQQSLLRLGPWMLAYGGITFGLASLTVWVAPESLSSEVQLAYFRTAHGAVALGFMVFALGYLVTPRPGIRRAPEKGLSLVSGWDDAPRTSALTAIGTYLLGFGALALAAALSGSYGYLGDEVVLAATDVSWYTTPLTILSSLRGAAILVIWVRALESPRMGPLLLAVAIAAVDFAAGFLSGMKEAPVTTFLAVMLAYLFVRRKLPVLMLAAFSGWFVLFLAPWVASVRNELRGNGVLTLQEGLSAMVSSPFQLTVDSGWEIWDSLSRFRLIDNVAIIIQKTPSELPFQSVSDLFALTASGFVPRAIWPTKPVRVEGLLFYQEYFGGSSYSSSALTIPGSLFMHGGIFVLLVGMLLFGILVRFLDDRMRANESRVGLLLILALFPSFVKMETSAPTLLASLPVLGVGWLLACWLLFGCTQRGGNVSGSVQIYRGGAGVMVAGASSVARSTRQVVSRRKLGGRDVTDG